MLKINYVRSFQHGVGQLEIGVCMRRQGQTKPGLHHRRSPVGERECVCMCVREIDTHTYTALWQQWWIAVCSMSRPSGCCALSLSLSLSLGPDGGMSWGPPWSTLPYHSVFCVRRHQSPPLNHHHHHNHHRIGSDVTGIEDLRHSGPDPGWRARGRDGPTAAVHQRDVSGCARSGNCGPWRPEAPVQRRRSHRIPVHSRTQQGDFSSQHRDFVWVTLGQSESWSNGEPQFAESCPSQLSTLDSQLRLLATHCFSDPFHRPPP
ncbi:hypothetical protein K431DRAFT_90796 [Polychaeton citri CBS 116435]|uniref:Uncharacterized protein n=1 Tax=Polychaeton citri CBS 116435 TaxID=1314669 RepID=A0A9P4Q6J0_9PEZI|nr:hypothetical protein K431DRAFT_90796 [Polychaeton citri CBS 116435]